jgi:beta-ribofuranosylaminobenzene 5'-phosphate synthase
MEKCSLRINIFSRLHLTLISMHDGGYRRNGGFGFAISEPSITVKFEKADKLEVVDYRDGGFDEAESGRMIDALKQEILQKKLSTLCKIKICGNTPSHAGFGSGTAIRLAVIEGLYLLNDYGYTNDELVAASGRGGTSGVGVHTYFHGGYSLDIGRQGGALTPSFVGEFQMQRASHLIDGVMPEWDVGICIPKNIATKSEMEEKKFFAATCPIEPWESYEAAYHALFGLLGGVKDGCMDTFCEAVKNIQKCRWKSAERSLYGEALMDIENSLYGYGAKAIGMSSLGPSLFFVADDIAAICEKAKKELDCVAFVVKPRNSGREIVYG